MGSIETKNSTQPVSKLVHDEETELSSHMTPHIKLKEPHIYINTGVFVSCLKWSGDTLALLQFVFSPSRPASRSLWPASSPASRGNLRHRSAPARWPESWAAMPPQSWEWCWCCLRWRRSAGCWALRLSGSSGCYACSGGAGALTLHGGDKKRQTEGFIHVCVKKIYNLTVKIIFQKHYIHTIFRQLQFP